MCVCFFSALVIPAEVTFSDQDIRSEPLALTIGRIVTFPVLWVCVCWGGWGWGGQLCEKQDTAPGKELGRAEIRQKSSQTGGRSETTACLHAVSLLHSGALSFTGSPSRTLSTMSLAVRPVRRPTSTSITRSQSFTGVNSTDKLPYRCV